ncbi:MAG TPA: hypothetical protein VGZ68_09700 [Acidimicrobiales bacterium]|jgi:hypothetical protein|nr:hypothetical protein [Acidimicrobiales bacterium]
MLLESADPDDSPDAVEDLTSASPSMHLVDPEFENSPLHDDVERLIQIAAQLFAAIERQIHRIEDDLTFTSGKNMVAGGQTMFKEQLIRTAQALDASLQEIARHLGEREDELSESPRNGQSRFLDYF